MKKLQVILLTFVILFSALGFANAQNGTPPQEPRIFLLYLI